MSQALYRKWRPKKFSELFGQEHVKIILQNALLGERIVHAYLFSGPRGSGKTTTARLLAKSVNCQNFKDSEPCNECPACVEIQKGKSLDMVEIDAASNRGIEDIKDLREKVKFTPSKLKYKIFVIDEVHMLTREAFNALLKTLEEPPSHVIFILATTEAHKIPQTILSRCQRFDFRRLSIKELVKRLDYLAKQEGLKIDDEAKKLIAQTSYGSARDADSLLDLIIGRGLAEITKKDVEEILGKTENERIEKLYNFLLNNNVKHALTILNEITEEGKDLFQFSSNLIEFLREELLKNPSKILAAWIKILCQAQKEMKTALFLQLPLELAIVEICSQVESESNVASKINKKEGNGDGELKAGDALDWDQVLTQLKPHNHSLCFLLQDAKVLEFKDGQLTIGVGFKFHKDKLEEAKNRKIIEQVVNDITGSEIKLICKVAPEIRKNKTVAENISQDEDLVKNIEKVFEIQGLDN